MRAQVQRSRHLRAVVVIFFLSGYVMVDTKAVVDAMFSFNDFR